MWKVPWKEIRRQVGTRTVMELYDRGQEGLQFSERQEKFVTRCWVQMTLKLHFFSKQTWSLKRHSFEYQTWYCPSMFKRERMCGCERKRKASIETGNSAQKYLLWIPRQIGVRHRGLVINTGVFVRCSHHMTVKPYLVWVIDWFTYF
jgi:hypothetical protein